MAPFTSLWPNGNILCITVTRGYCHGRNSLRLNVGHWWLIGVGTRMGRCLETLEVSRVSPSKKLQNWCFICDNESLQLSPKEYPFIAADRAGHLNRKASNSVALVHSTYLIKEYQWTDSYL